MDTVRRFCWLVALVACADGTTGDGDTIIDGTGVARPPVFNFVDSTPAVAFDAGVSEESLAAHQISTMLLSSTSIVVADEKVQDRLNTDGGGGYLRAAAIQCWERPAFPMFSFTLNYTGCANYLIGGSVYVNDHPSGPLLFEYSDFAIAERTLGGVLAFDTQGAYPDPLYWQIYNTAAENPGLDNLVPIGVNLGGQPYGVGYSGGAAVSFIEREWAMWGVMTLGVGKEAIQVVHGATDPDDVAPDEPTGVDVLSSSLDWLNCRCPTSGVQSQDLTVQFAQVSIDLDDLEDVPDGIDDPAIDVNVEYEVPGNLILEHTGCGTYDVDFTSEPVNIPLTSEQLEGAISFKCSTFEIADEGRCNAFLSAASRSGGVEIAVSAQDMLNTATDVVTGDFDTNWCVYQ
jgi:hypothetical protein